VRARPGMTYNMFPINKTIGFDKNGLITNESLNDDDQKESLKEMMESVKKANLGNQDFSGKEGSVKYANEPEILFLGTISMKPQLYRSPSAIYFHIPGTKDPQPSPRKDFSQGYGVIMDCSEGTYGQLQDHFQDQEIVDSVMRGLKVIFITHLHGDHMLGLPKMLTEWDKVIDAEDISHNLIYVCIPKPIKEFIDEQM
jgi:hypothetical protein